MSHARDMLNIPSFLTNKTDAHVTSHTNPRSLIGPILVKNRKESGFSTSLKFRRAYSLTQYRTYAYAKTKDPYWLLEKSYFCQKGSQITAWYTRLPERERPFTSLNLRRNKTISRLQKHYWLTISDDL